MSKYGPDIYEIYNLDPQAPWNAIDTPEDQICQLCNYSTYEDCACECPHPECDEFAVFCDKHAESAPTYEARQAYELWVRVNEPGEQ